MSEKLLSTHTDGGRNKTPPPLHSGCEWEVCHPREEALLSLEVNFYFTLQPSVDQSVFPTNNTSAVRERMEMKVHVDAERTSGTGKTETDS